MPKNTEGLRLLARRSDCPRGRPRFGMFFKVAAGYKSRFIARKILWSAEQMLVLVGQHPLCGYTGEEPGGGTYLQVDGALVAGRLHITKDRLFVFKVKHSVCSTKRQEMEYHGIYHV